MSTAADRLETPVDATRRYSRRSIAPKPRIRRPPAPWPRWKRGQSSAPALPASPTGWERQFAPARATAIPRPRRWRSSVGRVGAWPAIAERSTQQRAVLFPPIAAVDVGQDRESRRAAGRLDRRTAGGR